MRKLMLFALTAAALTSFLVACSSSGTAPRVAATPAPPILPTLHTITTIGSVVDPLNGDQNPYGLAVAPSANGNIAAGDLIVCDFNDGPTNTQGQGTSLLGIHPVAGATPYHLAQAAALRGCDAVAFAPDGSIVAADLVANSVERVAAAGPPSAVAPTGFNAVGPWGMIYASGPSSTAAFYETNSADGTIYRLPYSNGSFGTATRIATGFSTNRGVPGSVLAPSGLAYDGSTDTLYVVDGNVNAIYAFGRVSQIGADGVVLNGTAIGGASASSVRVVASGPPLNGPISAALLANGNLVVGNTLDPDGTNLLVEVSTSIGGVVATKNVDAGTAGALFGLATTGTSAQDQKIYFNDDNDNTLRVVSQ
ncbi:MAG: hypothetical protein JO101_08965 [Candidatus Eremiobacteraeota bacterium]|nr:hypothetical protein [Candidatus Eremiobacteraeota bacterium]